MLLSAGQRLRLGSHCESLPLEVAHLGAVLFLLAQIVGVEWLVLLLEHLEIGLVVALELILLLLLSSHFVILFLVHLYSIFTRACFQL